MAYFSTTCQTQEFSAPTISLTAGINLLDLPAEIRLKIYDYLFTPSKVILNAGNPSTNQLCLIPKTATARRWQSGRSSQLLRACRQILQEARPVLYTNTIFHIVTHTFAGSLPCSLSNGHPIASHARNVVWQMDCDILKRYYLEDFDFHPGDFNALDSLELICNVDTWKGSFCGEDCDRAGFIRGRKSVLEHGELLKGQLEKDVGGPVFLYEDDRFLGKGEVRVRLCRRQLG